MTSGATFTPSLSPLVGWYPVAAHGEKIFPKNSRSHSLGHYRHYIVTSLPLGCLGVRVVKEIRGLPGFRLPSFAIADIIALTPLAFTIALVAFMEAIAVAKAIDEKNNTQHVVPNKELVALGAANFLGAFFQPILLRRVFRTAVNNQSGGKI